jgi:hypothetical protein
MQGEMITLDWNRSSLSVNEGTTQTNRKNIEDEEITFSPRKQYYLRYLTGGISFDHGYITNNQNTLILHYRREACHDGQW